MTLIAAILSKKGVAVATDSLLTYINADGSHHYYDWEQPKIIPVPKLKACISYWGLAGVFEQIPKKIEEAKWRWQTYHWLSEQSVNPKSKNLEEFTKALCENLETKLKSLGVGKHGIGLHVTGIEEIENYQIPELFLISNYKDTSYKDIGNLSYSRHSFHTIENVDPSHDHRSKECRLHVNAFLNEKGFIIYNNGAPSMFNPLIKAFVDLFNQAQFDGIAKNIEDVKDTIPIVKMPIEAASNVQRNLYRQDKKLIGGRIHDLSIADNGIMYSSSGII